MFSKLVRAITVTAREGGGDPETNARLRLIVDRALAQNMPKENVTRAIERAGSSGTASTASSVTLEAYGPGGAALLIETVTDNRHRTVSEVRRVLANHGGSLGESGSVAWQFERRGLLTIEHAADPEAAELKAIDGGALDIEREGNSLDITTPPDRLQAIEAALRVARVPIASAQLTNFPTQPIALDTKTMAKLQSLVEELEEHDDVVEVTTNAQPPDNP